MSCRRLVRSATRLSGSGRGQATRRPTAKTHSTRSTSATPVSRSVSRRFYGAVATAPVPTPKTGVPQVESRTTATPVPLHGAELVAPLLRDLQGLLENDIGGDDLLSRRVASALDDLSSQRNGRVAVIGDSLAAPRDVVSALLQDPLTGSESDRAALLNRHNDADIGVFQISQGIETVREPEALTLSSAWLQTTGYDVVEVNSGDPQETLSTLLRTDALVFVVDPIRLLDTPLISALLPAVLSRGGAHIVINGELPPNNSEISLITRLRDQLRKVEVEPVDGRPFDPASVNVSFVRAEAALLALDALAMGLNSHGPSNSAAKTRAFDVFQKEFLASHMGPLQASLVRALKANTHPQLTTARQTAALALAHVEEIITADRDIVRTASHTVTELRRTALQGASKAKHLSVASRGIEGGLVEGGVQHEMEKVRIGLEQRLEGRLNWLGLVGRARVDDVAAELGTFLTSRFGVDLERQVIFETGELSYLQKSLDHSSDQTIRQLSHSSHSPTSSHPFTSPLLLNHLSTLSLSVPPLLSTSLLTPILTRREQLLTQSIPRLHASAQRALLTTYSTSLVGASLSWMSYVDPIHLTSAPTAAGLGILSVVSSLALGQKLWAKAQSKFWRDWKRITGMLKGDLETRFETALQTQVLAKPLAAADGLEKLIEKRKSRLDTLQDKVNELASRS
ncbi:hypothetical protein IAU60_001093 [Kwoniella sp. DSM 27419]